MSIQQVNRPSFTWPDPQTIKVGVYASAVCLAALAVIFGVLILITQHCNLHLGLLDDAMQKVIAYLGKYSFVPIAVSGGIWVLLVSVGIFKGCTQKASLEEDSSSPNEALSQIKIGRMAPSAPNQETTMRRVEAHMQRNRVDRAWQVYQDGTFKAKKGHPRDKQLLATAAPEKRPREFPVDHGDWVYLPPEPLLHAKVNQWIAEETTITDCICPDFIRDCAIQYEGFCDRCWKEDQLWSCFAGHQEYIADIANARSQFGLHVMISHRGVDISDHHRMEIFRSSHKTLLARIESNMLDAEQMKYFALFLLNHTSAIDQSDFDKICEISKALKQKSILSPDSDYQNGSFLMDLVEGKLSFQGIYGGKGGQRIFPPIATDLVLGDITNDWITEISHNISSTDVEETIRKGLFYLSVIPQSSLCYSDAQLALGNLWMDLENFSEAGQCFLRVVDLKNESETEAFLLASTCLLAEMKEGDNWVLILRDKMADMAATGKEVRKLSYQTTKSLTPEVLNLTLGKQR